MRRRLSGFTLVELLTVVAIIGIVVSIALPAYQNYTVKIRLTEGFLLSFPARAAVSEVVTGTDLIVAAQSFNATQSNSKFVESLVVDPSTGVITINFDAENVGLESSEKTITITPFVVSAAKSFIALDTALATGIKGPIDWACASETSDAAVSRGMPSTALGAIGVRSELSVSECR